MFVVLDSAAAALHLFYEMRLFPATSGWRVPQLLHGSVRTATSVCSCDARLRQLTGLQHWEALSAFTLPTLESCTEDR
ncbi:translation initiation factor 5A [Sarotherodon galilaeus]